MSDDLIMFAMRMTRRQMVLGLLGAGFASGLPRGSLVGASAPWLTGSPFSSDRRLALAAATERILPGAVEAGVPAYIDYWMLRYPFDQQLQKIFRVAAVHLDRLARREHGKLFVHCASGQQDAILTRFQTGELQAKNFPSTLFFEHLVRFTLEGFLSEPKYGGNRDQVGWKFLGRPPCWWQPRHMDLTLNPDQGLPW